MDTGTDALKKTLACNKLLVIHEEALALSLENFCLHLHLKVRSKGSLPIPLLLNSSLVVFVVLHLANCGQTIGTHLPCSCGVGHIRGHHRPAHHSSHVLGVTALRNLVAVSRQAKSIGGVGIVLTAKARLRID